MRWIDNENKAYYKNLQFATIISKLSTLYGKKKKTSVPALRIMMERLRRRRKHYPAAIPGLPDGAYHIYDYQFFYRNLQNNVKVRLEHYLTR